MYITIDMDCLLSISEEREWVGEKSIYIQLFWYMYTYAVRFPITASLQSILYNNNIIIT